MYMYLWLKLHDSFTVNKRMHYKSGGLDTEQYLAKMVTVETHHEKTGLLSTPKQKRRSDAQNRTTDQCLCFRNVHW